MSFRFLDFYEDPAFDRIIRQVFYAHRRRRIPMGKRLFLLYLLICSMPVHAQNSAEMEIQVVASPTHGLYYMIECLIDQPHRSPEMASTFRGRVGNWGPAQDALNEWEKQMNSDALSSLRLPAVQGRTPTLSDVLEKVALQAKNGEDLTARAAPWLGPEAAAALRNVLLVVEPLYEQYYWPGGAIKRKRETLLSDLKKADFQTSFSHACAFYRGQLPPGHQPTVALIPYVKGITEGKVRTRGHNSGDLQVIEVVVGQDDPGRAGVLFHEFVHALWAGQNPEEKNRWQERFEAHGLMGRLAYVQLNEGLATAIGNGWFDRKVQGQLNPNSWYSDPVIATYGRALYPVVREALEFGRPPTDAELDEMVDAFQRELPEAVSTFDVVAANFTTVSSREEAHQARYQKELMRLGPVRSSHVVGWESPAPKDATFQVLWLAKGESQKLKDRGWPAPETQFENYALRRTERGWELAFSGEHEQLFALLRQLQEGKLRETRQD